MPVREPQPPRPDERTPRLLGEFLRARRERLQPEDLGLPRGLRRRVPGLKREEAAQLCGISSTWYTWIEQGRTTDVSVDTLHAIAQGLQLSRAERVYLFELAARADPRPERLQEAGLEPLQALVGAVRAPAYVLDRHWDAIAWNRAAAELFGDWLGSASRRAARAAARSDADRNLLRYVFLDARAPRFIIDWQDRARRLVAEYRADTASWRDDLMHQGLVRELSAASAAFDAAWRSQQVQSRDGGVRAFRHCGRGLCRYDQLTLHVAQRTGLKLTVLLPRDR
ncbi:MAG: helix-turn-helix transcriptional regulator [Steroidobacteraceae bacterium]